MVEMENYEHNQLSPVITVTELFTVMVDIQKRVRGEKVEEDGEIVREYGYLSYHPYFKPILNSWLFLIATQVRLCTALIVVRSLIHKMSKKLPL
jgi:hypothetical protein